MDRGNGVRVRHARLETDAAVLLSRRGDIWQTSLADISATGVKLARPDGWRGRVGDVWTLDMLFGDDVNVHVLAKVVRITDERVALVFAQIPDEVQPALWTLLGSYAETLESWQDPTPPG